MSQFIVDMLGIFIYHVLIYLAKFWLQLEATAVWIAVALVFYGYFQVCAAIPKSLLVISKKVNKKNESFS